MCNVPQDGMRKIAEESFVKRINEWAGCVNNLTGVRASTSALFLKRR
jgi:hypothetical protein